jgi:hypothetical protein
MGSYDEGERLDGVAWEATSDVNRLLEILKGAHPEKNKTQWKRVFDVLYPEYQNGVLKGKYPVFAPYSTTAATSVIAMAKATNLDETTVRNFMTTLASAAKIQQIAMVALDPTVGGKLKGNIMQETAETAAEIAKAAAKAAADAAKEAMKGLWPIMLAAVAIVGFVYLPKKK